MRSYRRKDHIAVHSLKQALEIEASARHGELPVLSEMALPLKKFLVHADGLRRRIAINWCLCKWCQLFNPSCLLFSHWRDELATHLSHLNDINLKNGIDKRKHLYQMWVAEYDFNDTATVLKVIANKFYKESINDMQQRRTVAEAFAQHVGDVIDVISSPTNETMQYVESAFGVQ